MGQNNPTPAAVQIRLEQNTSINGTIFFQATDGQSGRELWKTDGTASGTALVTDLVAGNADSNPVGFTALGSDVLFTAKGNSSPNAFWKTNGTAGGTVLIKDLPVGLSSPFVTPISVLNGAVFFNADDGSRGAEMWKSDGTTEGTHVLRRMTTGAAIYGLHEFNGLLYFSANDGIHGDELWRTDGTENGTELFVDLNRGIAHMMFSVGERMYFKPEDSPQLWVTDGTPQGTTFVRNSATGQGLVVRNDYSPSLNAQFFTGLAANVNGTLFFAANHEDRGYELWKTDGTVSGAVLVKDIPDGGATLYGGSFPNNLVNVGGTLFFEATDNEHRAELWKSDGTESGTVLVKDIFPGIGESNLRYLTNLNGLLIFTANDGVHGQELWASDGTESGTVMIKDIQPGANGSAPSRLTVSGNNLFFLRYDDANGYGLWKTDGTSDGTVLVKAFGSRFFDDATDLNGRLFFTISDSINGNELWTSDGTAAGTHVFRDINPGAANSFPSSLSTVNGRLYFRANDGTHGTELWVTDGTTAGTHRLTDIAPGAQSSGTQPLVSVLGRPVFMANDGIHGGELWTLMDVNGSPMSADGTILVEPNLPNPLFAVNFGFADPHDTPSNGLGAVQILSLPTAAAGTLQFAESSVEAGQMISAAELTTGQLRFVPAAGAITGVLGSFTFRLQDDGGTAGVGVDFSAAQTITIELLPDFPWHNRLLEWDVNGDGKVVGEDVIAIINYIYAFGSGQVVSDGETVTAYYDVTGDNYVAADDVVAIINYINANPSDEEGEPPMNQWSEAGSHLQDNALLTLLATDTAPIVKRRK